MIDPLQMADELGGRASARGGPQVVQREQSFAVLVEQALDPNPLFIGQTAGKDPPETPLGTRANSCRVSFGSSPSFFSSAIASP